MGPVRRTQTRQVPGAGPGRPQSPRSGVRTPMLPRLDRPRGVSPVSRCPRSRQFSLSGVCCRAPKKAQQTSPSPPTCLTERLHSGRLGAFAFLFLQLREDFRNHQGRWRSARGAAPSHSSGPLAPGARPGAEPAPSHQAPRGAGPSAPTAGAAAGWGPRRKEGCAGGQGSRGSLGLGASSSQGTTEANSRLNDGAVGLSRSESW